MTSKIPGLPVQEQTQVFRVNTKKNVRILLIKLRINPVPCSIGGLSPCSGPFHELITFIWELMEKRFMGFSTVCAIKLSEDSYGLFQICIPLTVVNSHVTAQEQVDHRGEKLC